MGQRYDVTKAVIMLRYVLTWKCKADPTKGQVLTAAVKMWNTKTDFVLKSINITQQERNIQTHPPCEFAPTLSLQIIEIEREKECVLVVAHQAVLRAILGYFTAAPLEVCAQRLGHLMLITASASHCAT